MLASLSRFCLLLLLAGSWFAAAPVRAESPKSEDSPREIVSFTRGPSGTNRVALTFDDGPHPRLTPQLLTMLEAEGVTATFFLLGVQVRQNPELARKIVEQGHEIANHSHSHANLSRADRAAIKKEIAGTQDLIEETTGVRPRLFRAPYGLVNAAVRETLLEHDLELVGWAVDPRDWERTRTPDMITKFILDNAAGGDIILLHDIHSRSIASVIPVIHGLKAKGFEFTTAGDLIAQRRDEMKREAELAAAGLLSPARATGAAGAASTPPRRPNLPSSRSAAPRSSATTPIPLPPPKPRPPPRPDPF
jgi:peptidoglycan-N-acetylglucosamine deacetylase